MRSPLAVAFALAIIAGCGAFGTTTSDEPNDSDGSGGTPEAATSGDAASDDADPASPDASQDGPSGTDAKVDAIAPCTVSVTPFFDDDFNRTQLQGQWPPPKTDPTISMSIASNPTHEGIGALSINISAAGASRSAFLERAITPTPCHELEFHLYMTGYPTVANVVLATLELDGSGSGAIGIELGTGGQVGVTEIINSTSTTMTASAVTLNEWNKVIVRVDPTNVRLTLPTFNNAPKRTKTTANPASVRLGAPVPRTASASYLIDDVVVR